MSRTTVAGAATELYDLLTTDANGTPETVLSTAGVTKVYPRDPGAGGVVKPCSVTLQYAGWTPTDWRFAVRVYINDANDLTAQDRMISVTTALDSLLRDGAAFGPSQGEVGWEDEIKSWVAVSEVMVGREDGF